MKALLAVAAVALLLLPALATADGPAEAPRVSFHVPAQVGGAMEVGAAEWAIILVHDGALGVDLSLPEGAAATTQTVVAAVGQPAFDRHSSPPVPSTVAMDRGSATLAFDGGRWASLVLVADHIEATASGAGRLDAIDSGRAMEPLLQSPPPYGTLAPTSHLVPEDSAVAVLDGTDSSGHLRLTATGLRRVEWYNATASCTMACPDGPSYQAWSAPVPTANRVELRNYTALDLPGTGATATVAGVASATVLGGGRLDVAVDGWLRLPEALLQGCDGCGGGRTLRLDGDALGLQGLASEGPQTGRLNGRLHAPGAFSTIDEGATIPLSSAVAGVAVGGGLAVAAALALRALGILRVRAPEPHAGFGHQRRTGLFELVAAEPGLTFREVERRLGWGNGVTRHHLGILLAEGHLVARRHRNTLRYFENHGRFDASWRSVVHRRDPCNRWVLEVLEAAPRTQGEVVALAAGRGWSRSATQRKLARLVGDGLVAFDGISRRYSVRPAPEPKGPSAVPAVSAMPALGLQRTATPPGGAARAALARPAGTAAP